MLLATGVALAIYGRKLYLQLKEVALVSGNSKNQEQVAAKRRVLTITGLGSCIFFYVGMNAWYMLSGGTGMKREITTAVFFLIRTLFEWIGVAMLVFSLWPSKAERQRDMLKVATPAGAGAAPTSKPTQADQRVPALPPAVPKATRRRHSEDAATDAHVDPPLSPPAAPRLHSVRRSSEQADTKAPQLRIDVPGRTEVPMQLESESPVSLAATPALPTHVQVAAGSPAPCAVSPRTGATSAPLEWRDDPALPSWGVAHTPRGDAPPRMQLSLTKSPSSYAGDSVATEFRLSLSPRARGERTLVQTPRHAPFPMGQPDGCGMTQLGSEVNAAAGSGKGPRRICVYRPFAASSCLVQPREPPPLPSPEFVARVQKKMLTYSY